MPIYRLLQGAAFGPDVIKAMATAFEGALAECKLDRSDPFAEVLQHFPIALNHLGDSQIASNRGVCRLDCCGGGRWRGPIRRICGFD